MGDKKYLDIGRMARHISREVCDSLLIAHAVTSCDSVSYMYGIGKPTVAKVVLQNSNLLSDILKNDSLTEDAISKLETFVCKLYGYGAFVKLDALRAHLLFSCAKPEQLPMTSDAFSFHAARAFQTG